MSKTIVSNIKGGIDFSPKEMLLRNHITDTLRKNFESYGYLPLETASINYLSLLTHKYDENAEIVREIYKIRDQGERDLGLRFDLTIPFCKYIALNQNMKLPFKRYEIGKVWRNGPVKSGRAREFYQCDVDVVGITGVHIEAELISLAVKTFLELGIEPIVKYNSRHLLPKNDAIVAIIDRLEKVSPEETIKDLCKHMPKVEAEKLYTDITQTTKTTDNKELLDLQIELEKLGVLKYCKYTPSLARGLNVYTGTVWEIYDKAGRVTCAIGGGGRYDKIIGNFIDNGKEYPAVGTSFGLEPITAILNIPPFPKGVTQCPSGEKFSCENLFVSRHSGVFTLPLLMLIPLGTEAFCQTYADNLRKDGKNVLVYLGGKSMAKAFEYAASYGIRHCAVIGEDEAGGKPIVIKEIK